MKGILKINKKIPTLIAIPTTAGTGSETTVAAVITDTETHFKYPINSFPLIPSYAILDPEVTYSLPKSLTSTTGIDALTHAVEAYIGRSTSKETRRLSKEACKLIFENILVAYNNPNDKDARTNMLIAAHKAGIAFTKSYVGYVHAVAHSLGGKYNVPHGLANSVILPYVLELYGKKIYKKLYQLSIYCGLANKKESYKDAANKFIEAIKKLNIDMNIPNKILGIKEEDIIELAKKADKEANPLYPVPVLMNAKELEKIYKLIA
jgi:alcohol dehydrogenase class IV